MLAPHSHGGLALSVPAAVPVVGALASGCQNAQWIVGHCVLYQDDKPMMSGDGPLTGFFMLPAECWRIEETWQASGLTASGSHHIVLEDFHAPDASAFDLMQGMSCVP